MSTGLGPPVVVYATMGNCNGDYEHEIVFLTDGYKVLAYGEADATVSRKRPVFTVYCKEATCCADHLCDGEVKFDITEAPQVGPGWTATPNPIRLLELNGVRPDVED